MLLPAAKARMLAQAKLCVAEAEDLYEYAKNRARAGEEHDLIMRRSAALRHLSSTILSEVQALEQLEAPAHEAPANDQRIMQACPDAPTRTHFESELPPDVMAYDPMQPVHCSRCKEIATEQIHKCDGWGYLSWLPVGGSTDAMLLCTECSLDFRIVLQQFKGGRPR